VYPSCTYCIRYNANINRSRTSRSEQIKTSRDLWERINEKYDLIIEIGMSKGWPKDRSGVTDVSWAILMDEIGDKAVLRYSKASSIYIYIEVMKHYSSPDYRRLPDEET
jgi:hypothetical protein